MSHKYQPGTGNGVLRIASANLQEGGLDENWSGTRWQQTMDGLAAWEPDIVCLQEMATRRDPRRLRRHLWATANELSMTPVLGSEGGVSGNHPAILAGPRLDIIDEGPVPRSPGHDPAWCDVLLQVHGGGPFLRVYSVHLPPRSAAAQREHAENLAALIAQRGEHAVAGGDWNCYSPTDKFPAGTLEDLPPHLRPGRMHALPGRPLAPNHDVHNTLESTGLADAAAGLDPARRDPPGLTATGAGGGRIDRFYVTGGLRDAGAVQAYAQKDSGGSDHQMILLTLGLAELAATAPPGFRA